MEGIKASRSYLLAVLGILVGVVLIASPAVAAKKPNILVIWGDDIGWSTLGAYNHSVMKYHTPPKMAFCLPTITPSHPAPQGGSLHHRPVSNPPNETSWPRCCCLSMRKSSNHPPK